MKYRKKPGEVLVHGIIVTMVVLISVSCLIPFLNTVALSFSDKSRAAAGEVFLLPKGFTTASYKLLLKESSFFAALFCDRHYVGSRERIDVNQFNDIGFYGTMKHADAWTELISGESNV